MRRGVRRLLTRPVLGPHLLASHLYLYLVEVVQGTPVTLEIPAARLTLLNVLLAAWVAIPVVYGTAASHRGGVPTLTLHRAILVTPAAPVLPGTLQTRFAKLTPAETLEPAALPVLRVYEVQTARRLCVLLLGLILLIARASPVALPAALPGAPQ